MLLFGSFTEFEQAEQSAAPHGGHAQGDPIKMRLSGLTAFLRLAFSHGISRKAATVAAVVATILILINQGDALFGAASFDLGKALLTAVVPYIVATVGAVSALVSRQKENRGLPADVSHALTKLRGGARALQIVADSEPRRSSANAVTVELDELETLLAQPKA